MLLFSFFTRHYDIPLFSPSHDISFIAVLEPQGEVFTFENQGFIPGPAFPKKENVSGCGHQPYLLLMSQSKHSMFDMANTLDEFAALCIIFQRCPYLYVGERSCDATT